MAPEGGGSLIWCRTFTPKQVQLQRLDPPDSGLVDLVQGAAHRSVLLQAFSSLAEAAYEATDTAEDLEGPSTYCLSSSFELIVQKLLETTDR